MPIRHIPGIMARTVTHFPSVNRTELAEKIGKHRGYLTNILNGKKQPPLSTALRIYDVARIKVGPLAGKTTREIQAIARASVLIDSHSRGAA